MKSETHEHIYTLKTGTPVEDEDPILKLLWRVSHAEIQLHVFTIIYTLKTGTPIGDGDPILKLLWRVSHPEIQLGGGHSVGIYG